MIFSLFPWVTVLINKALRFIFLGKSLVFLLIVFFIACRSNCFGQAVFFYEYKAFANEEQTDTVHCLVMLLAERDGNSVARLIAIQNLPDGGRKEARYTCTLVDSLPPGFSKPLQKGEKWLYVVDMQLLEGEGDLRLPIPAFLFKLKIKGDEKFYEPASVLTCLDIQNWYKPIVISQRVLTMTDLTEDVVAPFFNNTEPNYSRLLKLETRSFGSANRNITLHLIIAANTLDSSIGESCKMDLVNIKANFRQIARELGVNFVVREFWGKAFSKTNVVNTLERLKPGQRDIVVFYFSGHGFRYTGEDNINYPQMSFRINHSQNRDSNGMNLMAVLNLLNRKQTRARLNLVISDCCNENDGVARPKGRDVLSTRSLPIKPNIDNLRSLFLPQNPSNIIVTAADRNQLASSNDVIGGYFSFQFLANLQTNLGGPQKNITWAQILNETRQKTAEMALGARCEVTRGVKTPCQQYPWFGINPAFARPRTP